MLGVNGSTTSATIVQSGATLGGSGPVDSVVVECGGTIAPGNSPGTLTITNGLPWAGGGNYDWQIFKVSGRAGESDTWDLINVAGGTWDISGLCSTNKSNINSCSLSGLPDTTGAAASFDASASLLLENPRLRRTHRDLQHRSLQRQHLGNQRRRRLCRGTGMFALELNNNDLFLTYTGSGAPIPEPGTGGGGCVARGSGRFALHAAVHRQRDPREREKRRRTAID